MRVIAPGQCLQVLLDHSARRPMGAAKKALSLELGNLQELGFVKCFASWLGFSPVMSLDP